MVATARATFDTEAAASRAATARALVAELVAERASQDGREDAEERTGERMGTVLGPEDLVMDESGLPAASAAVDSGPDLLLHVCASFCDAGPARALYRGVGRPVLLWSFREPGEPGDRLLLNSLCGANLVAHALVRDGGAVRLLHGDPGEPHVAEVLRAALAGRLPAPPSHTTIPDTGGRPRIAEAAARAALEHLRGQRIGAVGDPPPGFTPSEYDPEVLDRFFGLRVDRIELDDALDRFRAATPPERDRERADALAWQPSLAAHPDEIRDASAAVTTGLRTWRQQSGLSALAIRCWPELPVETGVCPCSSLSRLADEDVDTQCERDVHGAATMLLLRALGASPTYLVDTVDLEADRNLVRFWHCGAAATRLAADPADATQSIHCNRRIGIVGDFPLRTGRVIATRLTEDPGTPGGLRLLLTAGESVAAPNRFQGNTADVVLDSDAETFVAGLVTGGFPHHTVLAWDDVRPGLRTVADLLGIPVTEF